MQNFVEFDDIPVGPGFPPVLLPDIDLFFNQDLDLARTMIRRLMDDGLQVVKGAVLHRADLALDDGTLETYYHGSTGLVQENYRALLARKVVSLQDTEALFGLCRSEGVRYVLSVYDPEGAEFARDIGACALKIPSSNITHEALIRQVGRLGLPVLLDTGKSTLEEIARAVNWARDAGLKDLVIEHSPDAPPAPLARHHLRMMQTLQQAFQCPVGLSDHHHGEEMLLAAVALGASVLEKSICADDQAVDQDVYHATRFDRIGPVWRQCLNIHEALGQPMRELPRERDKPVGRVGLIARRDLEPGERLGPDTVDFAFPARGIGGEHWSQVVNARLTRALRRHEVIGWHDVELHD